MNRSKDPKTVLWKVCEDFIRDLEIGCAEAVVQNDAVILAAPELIEAICAVVGYHKFEDERK